MQAAVAGISLAGFPAGPFVRAKALPTVQTSFEIGIAHAVAGPAGFDQLNLIQQTLARLGTEDLKFFHGAVLIINHPGVFDVGPGRFSGLIAAFPVRAQIVVGAGIHQLQTAAAAVGPVPPSVGVGDLVHEHKIAPGKLRIIRAHQGDPLAAIRQLSLVIPDRVAWGELRILAQ